MHALYDFPLTKGRLHLEVIIVKFNYGLGNDLDESKIINPANGAEYMPTYEDTDGDWMLVGDVPWK